MAKNTGARSPLAQKILTLFSLQCRLLASKNGVKCQYRDYAFFTHKIPPNILIYINDF